MRTIKFRAWYKNEKLILPIAEIIFYKDGDILAFPLTREAISSYLVGGNVVLMQSTGLRDKNGRDIYEGDIIYCELNKAKAVVKYNDKIGQYRFHFFSGGREDLKRQSKYHGTDMSSWFISTGDEIPITVIGNIHENPELINR